MSRYIDADAYAAEMKVRQDSLKELMDDADAMDNWEMYDGLSRAFSVFVNAKLALDAMPTVDAVPVVHGEWEKARPKGVIIYSDGYAECSNCHDTIWLGWKMNYCPNCGAKMKGGKDDADN